LLRAYPTRGDPEALNHHPLFQGTTTTYPVSSVPTISTYELSSVLKMFTAPLLWMTSTTIAIHLVGGSIRVAVGSGVHSIVSQSPQFVYERVNFLFSSPVDIHTFIPSKSP
jgi:hypothetical protein